MDVAAELRELASRPATGRLEILTGQISGQIWLREGRISSVSLSTVHQALGMRLVSGGCLSLTHLGTALGAQKQHPGMRLGDVLVRLGLVPRRDVEVVAREQMCDTAAAILQLTDPVFAFTAMQADAVAPGGPTVDDLLTAAGTREQRWNEIVREVGGSDTVPSLTDELVGTHDVALRPVEWAVLCRVDGQRSLLSIARQAGFTTLEAATILQGLLGAGLVTVPQAHTAPPAPAPWQDAGPDIFDDPSALLRELSELGSLDPVGRRRGGR